MVSSLKTNYTVTSRVRSRRPSARASQTVLGLQWWIYPVLAIILAGFAFDFFASRP